MASETNPRKPLDLQAVLQAEFNTLDSALVAAILSDTDDIGKARRTLSKLQTGTAVDDFTAGHDSCPELGEGSSETGLTWRTDGGDEEPPSDSLESLRMLFPKLGSHTLKRVLAGCQGNVDRAIDELLNRSYLDTDPEEGGKKGIDGFDGELNCWGTKKGRGRKKRTADLSLRRTLSLPSESAPTSGAESRWATMSREIAYLSNCLGIETTKVQSVYHSRNGALAPTILALIENHGSFGESLDPAHLSELHQLSSEFSPAVSAKHLEGLLHLCGENKQAVFEFAEILSQSTPQPTTIPAIPAPPARPAARPPPKIITPNTADGDSNWTVIGHSPRPSPISPRNPTTSMTSREASAIAENYMSAGNEAFQKASAAHRMSKSNHLMRGAAAFYASVGQDLSSKGRLFNDIAAESFVDENSAPNQLDLHGATAKQAISISRERTTQWWVRNCGERNPKPFSIVTGLGRHSSGGKPVLLPAVSNMLKKEGWNIHVENGNILVYGVKAPAAR